MTLAELHVLDPAALWAALPYAQQMAIIVPLLRSEFANVCAEDDGTDCSRGDQSVAARINQDGFQQSMEAIETAFPEILGDDFTALRDGPTSEMMDGQGKAAVKGLKGRRVLYGLGRGVSVRIGGRKVEIAGFKDLGTEDTPIWEACCSGTSMTSACGVIRINSSGRSCPAPSYPSGRSSTITLGASCPPVRSVGRLRSRSSSRERPCLTHQERGGATSCRKRETPATSNRARSRRLRAPRRERRRRASWYPCSLLPLEEAERGLPYNM